MESDLQPASRGVSNDPLENICALLSELPTATAIKDLGRGRITESVRRVIETMALHKQDIIGGIAILSRREHLAMSLLERHYSLEEATKLLGIDMDKVNITFDAGQKD